MKHWKQILILLGLVTGNRPQAREVSLYNGAEKNFGSQDHYRVLNVLQSMGIPYRISSDRQILVSANAVGDVKEIVAQGFRQQRSAPQAQNHEAQEP